MGGGVTTILFVRHAPTDGTAGDARLSADGHALAVTVAATLAERAPGRVYSSPLLRARETADHIATALALDVVIDERLREKTNWGDVEGESFEAFLARWPRTPSAAPRLASFVDDICTRFPDTTIIAVTHGGIVDDLLGGHEHWPHCGITELVS
jgi:2,3-bisphosphoglycerate-dependent phosphoglycerate mutase